MSRIISDEQFKIFIVLLKAQAHRLDEMLLKEFKLGDMILKSEISTSDIMGQRDRLVAMCESLGGESS